MRPLFLIKFFQESGDDAPEYQISEYESSISSDQSNLVRVKSIAELLRHEFRIEVLQYMYF